MWHPRLRPYLPLSSCFNNTGHCTVMTPWGRQIALFLDVKNLYLWNTTSSWPWHHHWLHPSCHHSDCWSQICWWRQRQSWQCSVWGKRALLPTRALLTTNPKAMNELDIKILWFWLVARLLLFNSASNSTWAASSFSPPITFLGGELSSLMTVLDSRRELSSTPSATLKGGDGSKALAPLALPLTGTWKMLERMLLLFLMERETGSSRFSLSLSLSVSASGLLYF